ncbi:hypothetical protein FH972_019967 [Carpinus fangiana]|uniref:Cytochrome P450 n=1 Tax=Carpinus fangiana TaxID=176857 RepID=A0A5N6RSA4_9ROSI|nr:hypothetical protein FH972_019967 [Carpinus fangiana]
MNRHRFLDWTTEILTNCATNTAVFRRPGKGQGVITANPSNVEHMLKTNFENYPKGERFIALRRLSRPRNLQLRRGALEGPEKNRQPRVQHQVASASETARVLDLQDILERFAFDNVCKLAFDVDPGCLGGDGTAGADFMRAFENAATLSSGRFMYAIPILVKIKRFLNVGSERKLKEAIRTVHEFADEMIRCRREQGTEKEDDLLSRFMAKEENSPEFLRDIVISFILAGRDTTSSALSWFFWLLSSKPEAERNILKELENIRVRNGKNMSDAFTFDELRDMHYLHAAISEALRLYPPVPVDSKACLKDDIMPDGTFVGKGWLVTYHTYAMGRMESIWGKNCREFLPERWMENGVCRQESPFRFPVFHGGPRFCLGKDMAYIQMKSIAASVIERFEMEVVGKKEKGPQHLLSLTLRISGGLPVKLRKRSVDATPTN